MKIYSFKRLQVLPITLQAGWDFFSSPTNLAEITPPQMGFKILYRSGGDRMYAGQIIRYRIRLSFAVTVEWVTEITHVQEPHFFVDEQRSGPYSFWHHQHHFREVSNGLEITDEVNYSIPFGVLGRFANLVFVERQVNAIFDHRAKILVERFGNNTTTTR
jgi:ligand-binding SRPBCC domain-containing protein